MESKHMNKIPALTLAFWILKISATTLGETGGDLLSMTLNIGYTTASVALLGVFLIALILQLSTHKYVPIIYWFVILATSTAGTTMSDFMDRTLGLGYATGTFILSSLLALILIIWKWVEKSLSVSNVSSRRGELFYWCAILVSNTLGTALGDYLADDSGLGFAGGALLIGGLIAVIALLYFYTKLSRVLLFWLAFVLTRPFGATFGDWLTKPFSKGGLELGTVGSSAVLFGILIILVIFDIVKTKENQLQKQT